MMHRLLYTEEILLEIFDHCSDRKRNLTALARACKTFKEPALDILWAELSDLTPLARCLPDVSYRVSDGKYSLKRPLGGTDWDIISGFTRRVRVCRPNNSCTLTTECVKQLSEPPASITFLFPKLCELAIFSPDDEIIPFLRHFASPRLTLLSFHLAEELGDALDVFGQRCPNIKTFTYYPRSESPTPESISNIICQWPRLRCVRGNCPALNAAAVVHLSHLSDLNYLRLELSDAVVDRIRSVSSVLTFPTLVHYEIYAPSAVTVRSFLNLSHFLSIEKLLLRLRHRPTKPELSSLLASLPDACNHQSLTDVFLTYTTLQTDLHPYRVDFHHLHLLSAFTNIQRIQLVIRCGVDLAEQELLELASSWPHLQVFVVGWDEDCTPTSAITPGGFVQLLERCRSLHRFSFPFDTRGYTEIPKGHPWHGLEMPEHLTVDVRKSAIEEESIEALAVFFHVGPFPNFRLGFGLDAYRFTGAYHLPDPLMQYHERWERVRLLAHKLWEERRDARTF